MNMTFDFKSFPTVLLRTLMTLFFGLYFLFLMESCCGGDVIYGQTKIDLSNHTNVARSLVFSYAVGFLSETFGILCFRFFRKIKIELYIVKRWRIKKTEPAKTTNSVSFYDYLEKHPYAAGIHTLNHFYSMIPRPLFSILVFAAILSRPHEWYVWSVLSGMTFSLVVIGLYFDIEANNFDADIQKGLES